MDKDKLQILSLIIGMWKSDLVDGGCAECFEVYCDENIENEEQRQLMNKVKDYVDEITYILGEEE